MEARNKDNEDVLNVSFLILNAVPLREIFDTALDLLSSECQVLTINRYELFDKFTYFTTYLSKKESEWFNSTAVTKKWCEVFLHLKENNVLHTDMMKAVGFVMCLLAVMHMWKEYFHI